MKLILFLLSTLIAALAAKTILPGPECREDDLQKLAETLKRISLRLLHLKVQRDPTKSQAVAPLPIFCILAQLANDDDGPIYERIMKFLNMNSKQELRRVLKAAQDVIGNFKSLEKVYHIVFADKNYTFSDKFVRNCNALCGGRTENIDFSDSCKAADYVNQWFQSKTDASPYLPADESLFKKPGLVFATSFTHAVNLNHPHNPSGLKELDFYLADNTRRRFMGLYGNAFVEYAYVPELASEIVKIPLNRNEYTGIFICPYDRKMLPFVEAKLEDVTYYNKVIASLKPTCIKFTLVLGAVHAVNKLDQDLHQLNINLNGYHNCSSNVRVNGILQKVDLTAAPIENRDSVDSPFCQNGPYREVTMRSNLIYHFLYNFGGTASCGVFTGNICGGDIDEVNQRKLLLGAI